MVAESYERLSWNASDHLHDAELPHARGNDTRRLEEEGHSPSHANTSSSARVTRNLGNPTQTDGYEVQQ